MKLALSRCVVALFLAQSTLHARSQMSHEEEVVRAAYAKLAFLTEFTAYSDAALSSYLKGNKSVDAATIEKKSANATVSFDLRNFKTGPIVEIASNKWADTITAPQNSDSTIRFTIPLNTFTDNNLPPANWRTAKAEWGKADSAPEEARAKILGMSVQQVLDLGGKTLTYPDVVYSRYASFEVVAAFRGKTLGPYRAIFFFGKNAKGQEIAGPIDLYADQSALFTATTESFYPGGLLHTHLREVPIMADWLNRNQVSSSSANGDLCCANSRCGISQTDLQRELSTPLVPIEQQAR